MESRLPRRSLLAAALALALALANGFAPAQGPWLHGRVLDDRGQPIEHAIVRVLPIRPIWHVERFHLGQDPRAAGEQVTDARGGFRIEVRVATRAKLVAMSYEHEETVSEELTPGPADERSAIEIRMPRRPTLAVTVVDQDGHPLENANVTLEQPVRFVTQWPRPVGGDGAPRTPSATTKDGRIDLRAAPGVGLLRATQRRGPPFLALMQQGSPSWGADDVASTVERVELAPGERKELRLTLRTTGLLRCVAAPGGEGPLSQGTWELHSVGESVDPRISPKQRESPSFSRSRHGTGRPAEPPPRTLTLKTPEAWLPAGEYELRFVQDFPSGGGASLPAPGPGQRFSIRSGTVTELALAAPPHPELRAKVSLRGRAAEGLRVWLVPESQKASLADRLLGEAHAPVRAGEFVIRAVPAGRYFAAFRGSEPDVGWNEPLDIPVDPAVVNKAITLPAGDLRVRVRPALAATPPAYSFSLFASASADSPLTSWIRGSPTWSGDTALIENVPCGRYRLEVSGPDRTMAIHDDVIIRSDTVEDVQVELAQTCELLVRVVDPSGEPLQIFVVRVRGVSYRVVEGKVRCQALPGGTHRLEVTSPWPEFAGIKIVEDVTVEPGKLTEHVIVVRD